MFLLLLASILIRLPLSGSVDAESIRDLQKIPGVLSANAQADLLTLQLDGQDRVPLSAIEAALAHSGKPRPILFDQIPINRQVLFQVDAGQCFNCFQVPMRKSFEAESWVRSWNVVDYAPRGRFLFRIDTRAPATVAALGGVKVEEIWFSSRYEGVRELSLDWPRAGIEWRSDEATAVAEARQDKKPLLIFPTAGT